MEITTYIGLILTFLGTVFGIFQYFKSKKFRRSTLIALQTAAGDLCKIQQSTLWTFNNLRQIQEVSVNLDESENKKKIIQMASDGQGDAASADRMVIALFSHLIAMQETQFNKKEIIHPEKDELPLWNKQLKINKNKRYKR